MQRILRTRQQMVLFGLLVLVIAGITGLVLTRESNSSTAKTDPRRVPIVDEQPVQTARNMAKLAGNRDEQRFAQQALRLADHEVDLAFSDALRAATLHPGSSNPETKELFARVKRAQAQVTSDQDLIDNVKKESAKAKGASDQTQQQLDLLQAQLELDKDDLEDANADLLRSGADTLSRVQRQFARYQSTQQQNNATTPQNILPATETSPAGASLTDQFKVWRTLRAKAASLQQARDETLQKHERLQKKHDEAEALSAQSDVGQSQEASSSTDNSQDQNSDQAVIASLRSLAGRRKTLADLDKRIQDQQELADVYGNWLGLVQASQRAAIHGIVRSLLFILLIGLAVYSIDLLADRFFIDLVPDHRRMRTLRVIVRFVVQALGVLIVVFVVFGVPNQMPTILGLAGAGLTVALKDFIVAFIGWFTLMGRNGIRVGDWVEIQGVVGEVTEIGLFRTVLLETGNWNDAGHPTGRKVAFNNSFAIEQHYFNFSTSGQWLWDELQILVPASQNLYPILDAVQKLITTATEKDAQLAEEEWKRATHDRMKSVSAAPAMNLRPTPSGVEVHVRYITRAGERFATRTKLYQDIVGLLHQRPESPQPDAREARK
jgi:small-conductance mechanosensitive channel